MAWNTGTSYSGGSFLTAALINGIGSDLRTWGGNVDAGGYNLANLAQISGVSSYLVVDSNLICKSNSSQYGLGLYYNGASVVPMFLGVSSSGVFGIADAGGATRFSVTQAGAVAISSLPSSNPGAGTKQLWYDPADSNRVKFAA